MAQAMRALAICAVAWGLSMIDPTKNLALAFIIAGLVAGCAAKPPELNALAGDDVRQRHPIELRQSWQELSLPDHNKFDVRDQDKIANFVADWRRFGTSPIYLRVPDDPRNVTSLKVKFDRLRAALQAEGVQGSVQLIREPMGLAGRTPIFLLSFARMKAELATHCGQWTENLASSAETHWDNHVYGNFGCAYQNMIAKQAADPRDLFDARAESPVDAQMRVRVLNRLREDRSGQGGAD